MTTRVVMGAFEGTFGLKVSRPGYNVLSTTLLDKEVAFDSRWMMSGRIYMSGEVPWVDGDRTIYFGKTFNTPPVVATAVKGGLNRYWFYGTNMANIYEDRIVFHFGTGGTPSESYKYWVMEE